jgi:hypothetical protein
MFGETPKPADIKMVSVSDLLEKISFTADQYWVSDGPHEWFRMFRYKLADRQTPAIIRAIERDGFTDPICITVFENSGQWELGNGHHRLAIAILLGLDEIPVDFSGWYTPSSTTNERQISSDFIEDDYSEAAWLASLWD